MMLTLFCLVIKLLVFVSVTGVTLSQKLYSASIHWRPQDNNHQELLFTYRLSWKQLNLTHACHAPPTLCNRLLVANHTSVVAYGRWTGASWQCMEGCLSNQELTNLTKMTFTSIASFLDDAWESGEERFTRNFQADDNTNIIIGFKQNATTFVTGLEGHLSLAVRNDTGRPNISPVLNAFPIYRVPLNCHLRIRLFPFDGDGDYVRCHWEKFPSNTTARATLYEDICELIIEASTLNGYASNRFYRTILYAEDYSREPVQFSKPAGSVSTGPFCRVPIMFTVHVTTPLWDASQCDTGPTFLEHGTLPEGFVHSYPTLPMADAKLPFLVSTDNHTILTTGPQEMYFIRVTANGTTREEGQWNASVVETGIHLACGNAYTYQGVSGKSRCAVLMPGDKDECSLPNACPLSKNFHCFNLWMTHRCEYFDNDVTTICKTAKEGDDDLGLKVGLPVGLSLLILIIIAAVTAYLKRYWMEKIKKSTVTPEADDVTSDEKPVMNGLTSEGP